jgi:hypothetical protein
MTRFRGPVVDAALVLALFAASFAVSFAAMRVFRANGIRPWFYQGNFEPAVMMACGRGFVASTPQTVPRALVDFLQLRRNDFDCALLSASLPRTQVTWNGTWYYLYGTTAAVWRLVGITWTALDGLVALFGAVVTIALYGLFRLVAAWWLAAATALLLTISPANLVQMLSLRDYSKAPFVLTAILILAALVARPMGFWRVMLFAAAYGVLVGFGYGIRNDLAVMAPFGVLVVLLLLPGSLRTHVVRNVLAAALVIVLFVAVAWPALQGMKSGGGCQFHYALLGLTTPLTNEMGIIQPLYRFGDHFLDTFVDLKVGDYATRVSNLSLPNLCDPDYDIASGQLYMQMATTFPADFAAHAYGSVLSILRAGLSIPAAMQAAAPFSSSSFVARLYGRLDHITGLVAPLGPLLTLAAVGVAWARSARLGLALTVFVLFLTGYPAIEFEQRHWFHLRFIPWWAALMVGSELLRRRGQRWSRPELVRAAVGIAGLVLALAIALAALRLVQARTAGSLISRYESEPTVEIPIERQNGAFVRVDWRPRDYAQPPGHRGSDFLVVTLDSANCAGATPLTFNVKYDADVVSHDMSTNVAVARPAGTAAATRLFVPVYWQGFQDQTYLKFSGIEVIGAPATCVGHVGRVANRASLPLWVEMQLPADWSTERLYQSIRAPRLVVWMTSPFRKR